MSKLSTVESGQLDHQLIRPVAYSNQKPSTETIPIIYV